jgi:predicted nucleic acid-binding Zn ribbon protein
MPTYEFRCPDGTIIERVFRISEVPSEIPVPDGEGMATRIISGGAALLFKGSGFYITDYGKDGKKDQRPAGDSKSSTSESKPTSAPATPPATPKSE